MAKIAAAVTFVLTFVIECMLVVLWPPQALFKIAIGVLCGVALGLLAMRQIRRGIRARQHQRASEQIETLP